MGQKRWEVAMKKSTVNTFIWTTHLISSFNSVVGVSQFSKFMIWFDFLLLFFSIDSYAIVILSTPAIYMFAFIFKKIRYMVSIVIPLLLLPNF